MWVIMTNAAPATVTNIPSTQPTLVPAAMTAAEIRADIQFHRLAERLRRTAARRRLLARVAAIFQR